MTHGHRDIDRQGRPVYLEATSSRSAALYRRHGYPDLDPYVIEVGQVPFYRMWRPAACLTTPSHPAVSVLRSRPTH